MKAGLQALPVTDIYDGSGGSLEGQSRREKCSEALSYSPEYQFYFIVVIYRLQLKMAILMHGGARSPGI